MKDHILNCKDSTEDLQMSEEKKIQNGTPKRERYVSHLVKAVLPLDGVKFCAHFDNGVTKIYDMSVLYQKFPIMRKLDDRELFEKIHSEQYGIVWNDNIDLSAETVWERGELGTSPFDGLIAFKDAERIWNLPAGTLAEMLQVGRIKQCKDCMCYGKEWVITRETMTREFGPEPTNGQDQAAVLDDRR